MKVAVAHPDRVTVNRLCEWLLSQSGVWVAWTAQTAPDVLTRTRLQKPDLLLMGLDLPGLPVSELTERIMAASPCRILLLHEGGEQCKPRVFDALGQGAADAAILPEPAVWSRPERWGDLLNRLNTLRTLTGHAGPARPWLPPAAGARSRDAAASGVPPVVAIGASTGGPKALATLLAGLPAGFPAAVVIVQHLDSHFTAGLAEWLDQYTPLPVAALSGTARLAPGKVWVAARAEHLVFGEGGSLGWTARWPELACRPSIDVLFDSLARFSSWRGCGVLLTGMGRDGANGLLALRQAGFHTLAQEKASCLVYGMPRVAVKLGAAECILPLAEIAGHLVEYLA